MSSVNTVILLGRVGQDPDIRSTNNGKEIANISIATSEKWKDKQSGECKEKTEWHKVVIFNENLVNLIKNYVKKGSQLYIEGSLQTRKWQDNNGQDKYSTEVILSNFGGKVVLLRSSDNSNQNNNNNYSNTNNQNHQDTDFDDDVPF